MPTIFAHALAGTALGQWFPRRRFPARFWMWTAACAMLPDIDVIGFPLGIRYDDMLGHRGLTHSLAFAAVLGGVAATKCARAEGGTRDSLGAGSRTRDSLEVGSWTRDSLGVGSWELGVLWLYFTLITASHGVLDAFTNGGRGIAFLAPFSNHRFFFPWRPIQVSPIGVGFFSARGLDVLWSELRWILLPSAIIAAVARIMKAAAPWRTSAGARRRETF